MEDKKKPGRPKKQTVATHKEHYGIVNVPDVPENIVELTYCNPLLFKKIFTLLKSYSVSCVELSFDAVSMKINATDHLKKSIIFITINCKYANKYYCKEPAVVNVQLIDLEKATHALTTNHNKIMFILGESFRTSIYCGFTDMTYNVEEVYEIPVMHNQETILINNLCDDAYPLKFMLSSKHFKDKIAAISNMSDRFSIQAEEGKKELTFKFVKPNGMSMEITYRDPIAIKLVNTMQPGDILNVDMIIDYIYPFSNSNIGKDILICLDKIKPLSMTSQLDLQADGEHTANIIIYTEK